MYSYRASFPLYGMSVVLFEAPYYPFGIQLQRRVDEAVSVTRLLLISTM